MTKAPEVRVFDKEMGSSKSNKEDKEESNKELGELRSNLATGSGIQKDISRWPKYLYDAKGSALFEKITKQPEYYQTRAERSVLESFAKDFAEDVASGERFTELVELGSGSSTKTRALLDAMIRINSEVDGEHGEGNGEGIRYVPLDVSKTAIEESADSLQKDYPSLSILGYVGDFDGAAGDFLSSLTAAGGRGFWRIVMILGGTIGNFTPPKRTAFLSEIRQGMINQDRLLIGVDLVKDRKTLESAYNDSAGVTASFNKNILYSLNDAIGSEFDPHNFDHQAVYNEDEKRIEMFLISRCDQDVPLGDHDLHSHFSSGEALKTEISTKFTLDSASEMFEGTGLELLKLYRDNSNLFGLALARLQ